MTALILSNVLAWSAQVAAIVIVCAPLPRMLRLPAHVQYGFWRIALGVCIALPILEPWHLDLLTALPIQFDRAATVDRVVSMHRAGAAAVVAWPAVIGVVFLVGVACRLVWLVVGWLRLRRICATGDAVSDGSVGEVSELMSTIGARADIRWIDGLRQPATFGLGHPVVLLPESLRLQAPAIRRAVIAHELFHVQRRDSWMLLAEEIVRAMTWFHPAMWWLVSRVRLAREGVVDELTVLLTGARQTYLDALLLLADEAPLGSSPFSRRRQLFYRVLLISKEVRMTSGRFVAATAVLTSVLLATGWTAAAAFPLHRADAAQQLQNPPAPAAPAPPRDVYRNPPPPPPPAPPQVAWRNQDAADAIHIGGQIKTPIKIRDVKPAYPEAARAAGVQGVVILSALIDREGNVEEVHVLRSIPLLDAAAVEAVSQWKFRPVLLNGAPVPVIMTLTVNFTGMSPEATEAVWQSPDAANALRVGANIAPPEKIHDVRPDYPEPARNAGVRGVVIVEALLDRQGNVEEVHVLRSIPLLDQAAIDALSQWKFTPVLLNGAPMPAILTMTVNFSGQ